MKLIIFAALCFAAVDAQASNFAECILDKMPGTANAPTAFAAFRLCTSEHPQQYFAIKKGSGRGVFGFTSSEACIVKKARDTVHLTPASMIAAACRCLYDEPSFKDEACAYAPVPWESFK